MPHAPLEEVGADFIVQPKIRSCHFPVKSIFIGVIAYPFLHRNFDRRILLEQVRKQHVITKLTSHTNFSDDVHTYESIWSDEWIQYSDQSSPLSPNEILEAVPMHYSLNQEISSILELSVVIYVGDNGNTKILRLEGNDDIFNMTYRNKKDKSLLKVNIPMSTLVLNVR